MRPQARTRSRMGTVGVPGGMAMTDDGMLL